MVGLERGGYVAPFELHMLTSFYWLVENINSIIFLIWTHSVFFKHV